MVCLWIAWVCQWFVYGLPVVCIYVAGGLSMVWLWFANELAIVLPWLLCLCQTQEPKKDNDPPPPDREETMWNEIMGSCVSASSKRQKKHGETLEIHIAS